MKTKIKLGLYMPLIAFYNFRAWRLSKAVKKYAHEDRYSEQFKTRWIIKRAKTMLNALNIKVVTHGFENIPSKSACILMANHASLVDSLALIVAMKHPNSGETYSDYEPTFLAKEELKKNKKVVNYMNVINTFYINRENPRKALETLDDFGLFVKQKFKKGIIFPEGTRTKTGKIGPFKSGAFYVAKKYNLPIVPVTINNTFFATKIKNRNDKLVVEIFFHNVIKTSTIVSMNKNSLALLTHKKVLSKYKTPQTTKLLMRNEKVV